MLLFQAWRRGGHMKLWRCLLRIQAQCFLFQGMQLNAPSGSMRPAVIAPCTKSTLETHFWQGFFLGRFFPIVLLKMMFQLKYYRLPLTV